jgi:hypothetical protein
LLKRHCWGQEEVVYLEIGVGLDVAEGGEDINDAFGNEDRAVIIL